MSKCFEDCRQKNIPPILVEVTGTEILSRNSSKQYGLRTSKTAAFNDVIRLLLRHNFSASEDAALSLTCIGT